MKKLIFGCALFAVGMHGALTAGNCGTCCDTAGFEGLYVGGNIGVFSHTSYRNDLDGFLTDNSGWSTVDTNVTAGLQLGYDWQCNYSLLGLVVDWNWTNNDFTMKEDPNDIGGTQGSIKSEFDWFTTIRARAGLTVCDALVYVTGGAAVARFETTWEETGNAPTNVGPLHFNDTRWGWTGGVGAEFNVWCNWSLGAEFLFLHFSDNSYTRPTTSGSNFAFGHSDSAWVGRVLLNYRFGDLCCWW